MQRAAHGGYLGRPMHDQITLSGRDVAQSRLVSSRVSRAAERDRRERISPCCDVQPYCTVAAPSLRWLTRFCSSRMHLYRELINKNSLPGMESRIHLHKPHERGFALCTQVAASVKQSISIAFNSTSC